MMDNIIILCFGFTVLLEKYIYPCLYISIPSSVVKPMLLVQHSHVLIEFLNKNFFVVIESAWLYIFIIFFLDVLQTSSCL